MNKYDELLNKLNILLVKAENNLNEKEALVQNNQTQLLKNTNKIQENKMELEKLFYIRKVLTNYTFDLSELKKKRFWVRAFKFILRVLGIGMLIFIIGSYVGLNLITSLVLAFFFKVIFEVLKLNLSENIEYILVNYNLLDTQTKINELIGENKELQKELTIRESFANKLKDMDLTKDKEEIKSLHEDIKLVLVSKEKALNKVLTEEMNEKINQEYLNDDIIKRVRVKEG